MKAQITETLKAIIDTAAPQLSAITDTDAAVRDTPDKWSKKQILGHLIDSAVNNHRRFNQFLNQEHLVFDGYDQNNEVKINDYQNRHLADIIALWRGMNQQIIQIIKSIPDQRFTQAYAQHNYHRLGMKAITESDPTTIQYLALNYIDHLEHHLAQLLPTYEKNLGDFKNEV